MRSRTALTLMAADVLERDLLGKFSWKLNDWQAPRRRAHRSLTSLNTEGQHRGPDSSESIPREPPPTSFDLHRSGTVESEVRRCLQAQSRSPLPIAQQELFQLVGAKRTLPKYRHSAKGSKTTVRRCPRRVRPRPSRLGVSVGASERMEV